MRSNVSEEQFCNHYFLFLGRILDKMFSIYLPNSVFNALRSYKVGGPVQVITFSIWFNVDWPSNRGRPVVISPNKHPKLHTSADF